MKQKNRYIFIICAAIVLIFLATRLYHILSIPIFTDESIYIRWAEIFRSDHHQVFVSLNDGKQPLYIWLVTAMLYIFHNSLLAGRLASVLAGFVTMVGLYCLVRELFGNKRLAIITSALYVFFPFSLLYDKMALYDSLLATFAVWSLYLEVLLVRQRRIRLAIISALVIGGGLYTKSSAFFYLFLLPFSLLLFDFRIKKRNWQLLKWLLQAVITTCGAIGIYLTLKLSTHYDYIASKNNAFIYPFHEWLKHPLSHFGSNLHILGSFLLGYATLPLLILVILSFVVDKKYIREKMLLCLWFVIPFGALALFGKLLYPRYILFMTMFLLPLATYCSLRLIEKFRFKYLAIVGLLILGLPLLSKDYFILTNFSRASIPQADHLQYIEGFDSGYGVSQAETYLRTQSQRHAIYIGTQGTFGLMPEALQDYFFDYNEHLQIQGFDTIENQPPAVVMSAAKHVPTYFVFYAPCPLCSGIGLAPKSWPLKLVVQIPRLQQQGYLSVYQVLPD